MSNSIKIKPSNSIKIETDDGAEAEAAMKDQMIKLAAQHASAHEESIDHWDHEMEKAVAILTKARHIYTASWEGRLLWLERAAGLLQVDTCRSTAYGDKAVRLYWADSDGEIVLNEDDLPEVEFQTVDRLSSMLITKVENEDTADGRD